MRGRLILAPLSATFIILFVGSCKTPDDSSPLRGHYENFSEAELIPYKGKVKIFDSAEIVANRLKWILEKENLLTDKRTKDNLFYISDYTESFAQTAQQFFGGNLQLKENNLWE